MIARSRLETRLGPASVRFVREFASDFVLLAIHGAGHAGETFTRLFDDPALARYSRVALDLPGRHESAARPRSSVDDAAFAGAVLDVVAGNAKRVAIGHSSGGGVAIEMALAGTVDRIVLVSSGARLRVHPDTLAAFAAARRGATGRPHGLGYSSGFDPVTIAELDRAAEAVPIETALTDWEVADRFDRLRDVAGITVPTLVVAGDDDPFTPFRYGEYLAAKIPNATLLRIAGGSHLCVVERAHEVAEGIADFLEGCS